MSRWLAYTGAPVLLRDALFSPAHALIDKSLQSRLGAEAAAGDGYGIGWYGAGQTPAVFREIEPAASDANLRELAGHVTSPMVFAHIRASSGTAVQKTNCHPFRHGRWLWMHNGLINDFNAIKRDVVLDVDPTLFPSIEGQTDSEVIFYLALTLELEHDPPSAVAGAIALVEAVGRRRGVEHPFQGTIATTDGQRLWVFRYSSAGHSPSLFMTTDVPTLRGLYPELAVLERLSEDTRLVVSEPLGDLPGAWSELPESSYAVIGGGQADILPFTPPRSPRAQRPLHVAGSWPS
jgi:glutamine amidotransferase